MAAKKVGTLVKEARMAAGLTQEKLAKAAGEGLTASEIGKCERGEADLTAAQLKAIAKACGVTQKSLIEAPKNISAAAKKTTTSAKTSAAAKTSTAKTSSAKTSAGTKTGTAKTSSAKTTTTAAKKTSSSKKTTVPANANISLKVTSTEQKLIEAYRASTSDRKKAALKLLNGEYGDTIDKILSVTNGTTSSSSSSSASSGADMVGELLGNVIGGLFGGK